MDKIELSTFPSNKNEALTILYLQNQDLSGKTPEEIYELYKSTLSQFKKCSASKVKAWT